MSHCAVNKINNLFKTQFPEYKHNVIIKANIKPKTIEQIVYCKVIKAPFTILNNDFVY